MRAPHVRATRRAAVRRRRAAAEIAPYLAPRDVAFPDSARPEPRRDPGRHGAIRASDLGSLGHSLFDGLDAISFPPFFLILFETRLPVSIARVPAPRPPPSPRPLPCASPPPDDAGIRPEKISAALRSSRRGLHILNRSSAMASEPLKCEALGTDARIPPAMKVTIEAKVHKFASALDRAVGLVLVSRGGHEFYINVPSTVVGSDGSAFELPAFLKCASVRACRRHFRRSFQHSRRSASHPIRPSRPHPLLLLSPVARDIRDSQRTDGPSDARDAIRTVRGTWTIGSLARRTGIERPFRSQRRRRRRGCEWEMLWNARAILRRHRGGVVLRRPRSTFSRLHFSVQGAEPRQPAAHPSLPALLSLPTLSTIAANADVEGCRIEGNCHVISDEAPILQSRDTIERRMEGRRGTIDCSHDLWEGREVGTRQGDPAPICWRGRGMGGSMGAQRDGERSTDDAGKRGFCELGPSRGAPCRERAFAADAFECSLGFEEVECHGHAAGSRAARRLTVFGTAHSASDFGEPGEIRVAAREHLSDVGDRAPLGRPIVVAGRRERSRTRGAEARAHARKHRSVAPFVRAQHERVALDRDRTHRAARSYRDGGYRRCDRKHRDRWHADGGVGSGDDSSIGNGNRAYGRDASRRRWDVRLPSCGAVAPTIDLRRCIDDARWCACDGRKFCARWNARDAAGGCLRGGGGGGDCRRKQRNRVCEDTRDASGRRTRLRVARVARARGTLCIRNRRTGRGVPIARRRICSRRVPLVRLCIVARAMCWNRLLGIGDARQFDVRDGSGRRRCCRRWRRRRTRAAIVAALRRADIRALRGRRVGRLASEIVVVSVPVPVAASVSASVCVIVVALLRDLHLATGAPVEFLVPERRIRSGQFRDRREPGNFGLGFLRSRRGSICPAFSAATLRIHFLGGGAVAEKRETLVGVRTPFNLSESI